MKGDYYSVEQDSEIADRWYLRGPIDRHGKNVDPRIFIRGNRVEVASPLWIPLRRSGSPLDFTFADFDMPVVSLRAADVFLRCAQESIQLIPARVEGASEEYAVLVATIRRKCIDESKSEIMWWTDADGRPDKAGQYRMISNLRIDPHCVKGESLFRLEGWHVTLVASEFLKREIEESGIRGIAFTAL